MTDESKWLIELCDGLIQDSAKYEDRAFFQQLKAAVLEQDRRLEQTEGELDGRVWNPGKW